MSASASSVSPSLPTVKQLLDAISSDQEPDRAIHDLFHSTLDTTPTEASRIADARRVYKIVKEGNPPLAVFYKLEDPRKLVDKTSDAYYKVLAKAIKRPTNYEALMEQIDYFKEEGDNPAEKLVAAVMSRDLSGYMHKYQKKEASGVTENEIRQLFDDVSTRTRSINVSINSFFTVPDRTVAGNKGILYDPASNKIHNWGVNAVWIAAVAARKAPISILSPILLKNGEHPEDTNFTPGSSAFALEIAIAIKMGYTLSFSPPDAQAKLLPPDNPKLNVTLPTRTEQEQIYTWCCSKRIEAITQFKNSANTSTLPDIIYPYESPSTTLSLAATATKVETPHTSGSPLLSQFKLQQSKAAVTKITLANTLDSKPNNEKPATSPTGNSFKP